MRMHSTFANRLLGPICLLAVLGLPAFGSACLNPCTGSSSTGQDTTDRNNFNSDNGTLSFSNITFNNATGTYDPSTTGLNSTTAASAQLYGVSFIGCLSGQSPCVSNSNGGLVVGNLGSWDGGTDPALTNAAVGYSPGNSSTITVTLPANVLAIGFDLLLGNYVSPSSTTPFGVIVSNGSTSQFYSTTANDLPGSVFFGYSSATAISSLTIFAQNTIAAQSTVGIDNFEIGEAGTGGTGGGSTAAPEVSTMLMVASGFFMLRFGRRWLPL
jgi:hypothetical protein